MYCHLLTSLKIVLRTSFFPALLNSCLHENQQKRWIFIQLRFSDDLRGHIQIEMMERCEWDRNLLSKKMSEFLQHSLRYWLCSVYGIFPGLNSSGRHAKPLVLYFEKVEYSSVGKGLCSLHLAILYVVHKSTGQMDSHVVASSLNLLIETVVRWPNGLASFLTSTCRQVAKRNVSWGQYLADKMQPSLKHILHFFGQQVTITTNGCH